MWKKAVLLAMSLAAISALAVPALAQAEKTEWTKQGVTLNNNIHVHYQGTLNAEGEIGGFQCPEYTETWELLKGTHNKIFREGRVINPKKCDVKGLLAALCGTNSITSGGLTKEASGTGTTNAQIHVTGVEVLYEFGSCLSIVLSGGYTSTLDSATNATKTTISGELETGGFGNVVTAGALEITEPDRGIGIGTFLG